MKLAAIIVLAVALIWGPDIIGWIRFAYHCSAGCAASIGG